MSKGSEKMPIGSGPMCTAAQDVREIEQPIAGQQNEDGFEIGVPKQRQDETQNLADEEPEDDIQDDFKDKEQDQGEAERDAFNEHVGERHIDGEDDDDDRVHQYRDAEDNLRERPARPAFL